MTQIPFVLSSVLEEKTRVAQPAPVDHPLLAPTQCLWGGSTQPLTRHLSHIDLAGSLLVSTAGLPEGLISPSPHALFMPATHTTRLEGILGPPSLPFTQASPIIQQSEARADPGRTASSTQDICGSGYASPPSVRANPTATVLKPLLTATSARGKLSSHCSNPPHPTLYKGMLLLLR